ncbi:protein-L-isoaspartate O-methyltransferase [Pseudothermotoga thermarum]|uniref:Protein-L-isoaspartate O-methyltransferase n=1 Tax=Pseudothermotoga thermarum DSM 5069 TaxID=688269 RepID=F7YWB6_9THEM|nr:protein-L-isoaspartate O-methyltransferase [Pseudothermotoga thermarum]AEH51891.1 Protein-L-isoaspartate(D-aspartate) O-methyltransferase [Pseudothermotoga thermarum DSM 5069]
MKDFWKERFIREISSTGNYSDHILKAFLEVPRELFCEYPYDLSEVYTDGVLATARDENEYTTSSQPSLMALFMESVCLKPEMKVLEIGSGTGYNACVMGKVVGKDGLVVGLEFNKKFCELAKRNAEKLGMENVIFLNKDGYEGAKEYTPFDAIVVTVAVDFIPEEWLNQLKEGGRIIAPIDIYTVESQPAVLFVKRQNEILCQEIVETRFLKAKGKLGNLNNLNLEKLGKLREKPFKEELFPLRFSYEFLRILHLCLWSLCEEYGRIYHVEETGYAMIGYKTYIFGEVKKLEKVVENWRMLEFPLLKEITIVYDKAFEFRQLSARKGGNL